LAAEFDWLVEAEKPEIAEFLEQLVRGKLVGLLPFVDKGIDFGGDEFLQDAAWFVVVGCEEHCFVSSSINSGDSSRLFHPPLEGEGNGRASITKPSQPHLPAGEVLHDLLAAAADGVDLDLAVDALDPNAAHKTGAAENLHRFGGAERHGLRGLVLQHADLGDRTLALIE